MKEHAKLFECRGQQVLVYLDHDEEQDNLLVMRLRLWCDAVAGPLQAALTIKSEEKLSEEAVKIWEENTAKSFAGLTAEKVDEVLAKMDVWNLLDRLNSKEESK